MNMIFGIVFLISISFVLKSLKGLINFSVGQSEGWYTLIITILCFCICISWYSTYELNFAISWMHQLLCSLGCVGLLHPCFFYLRFDLHEIQCNFLFVSPSKVFISFKCISVSLMANVFSLFANSDISWTFFLFLSIESLDVATDYWV